MNGVYIHSVQELPAGVRILVYGVGGRGHKVLRAVRRLKHVQVLGFIDSFKAGEFCGLPVFALGSLEAVLARSDMAGVCIVIASAFHHKIGQGLDARGLSGYKVFLDKGEGPPLLAVPVQDLARALSVYSHPLKATRRRGGGRSATRGMFLRCPSLSAVYFRPSGLSLCCWMPDLVDIASPGGAEANRAALARLDAARHQLTEDLDQGRNRFCASCPDAYETQESKVPEGITGLHLDISIHCNLSCSYCIVKGSFRSVDYDFEGLCDDLQDRGLLAQKFSFDWGGAGEPTLYPGFADRTRELLRRGGSGLVFTNALKYSDTVAEGLRGRLRIVCSLDAGTRKTYAAVRGADGFEVVWGNIRRYLAAGPDNVTLKYIVTPQNSAPEDLCGFVARCREEGVRSVCLSRDFSSGRVTPAEEEALAMLAGECQRAGVGYHFLGSSVPKWVRDSVPRKLRVPQALCISEPL